MFIEREICDLYPEHGRKRYASNGLCVQCTKERAALLQKIKPEAHRERQKRYIKNNPDMGLSAKYTRALRLLHEHPGAIPFVAALFNKSEFAVQSAMENLKPGSGPLRKPFKSRRTKP